MSEPDVTPAPELELNRKAQQLGLDMKPEELRLVVSSGFTERFMGSERVWDSKAQAWRWRNGRTKQLEHQPYDVCKYTGEMLAHLETFCSHHANRLAWSVNGREDEAHGRMFNVMIGRQLVHAANEPGSDEDVVSIGAASSPNLGLTVAVAMLQVCGFDFAGQRRALIEDRPRIVTG